MLSPSVTVMCAAELKDMKGFCVEEAVTAVYVMS